MARGSDVLRAPPGGRKVGVPLRLGRPVALRPGRPAVVPIDPDDAFELMELIRAFDARAAAGVGGDPEERRLPLAGLRRRG